MKTWICMHCGRRGESEDNIIMKICNACQEEMEVIESDEAKRIYVRE